MIIAEVHNTLSGHIAVERLDDDSYQVGQLINGEFIARHYGGTKDVVIRALAFYLQGEIYGNHGKITDFVVPAALEDYTIAEISDTLKGHLVLLSHSPYVYSIGFVNAETFIFHHENLDFEATISVLVGYIQDEVDRSGKCFVRA